MHTTHTHVTKCIQHKYLCRCLHYSMVQAARLFFRQVDTMQKQIFEYKNFKKSEKFIKNVYHKRFLKSSSFHFFLKK